jgi:hypothetical protein
MAEQIEVFSKLRRNTRQAREPSDEASRADFSKVRKLIQ